MHTLYRAFTVSLMLAAAGWLHPALANGTLKVEKSIEVHASPATVWKMIGHYNHLDVWHPAVVASDLTGSGSEPGDVRVLTLGDGATITEKLVAYSETDRNYTYAIQESPLPVEGYVSTLAVSPAESGGSVVKWVSSFDAKGAPSEEAVEVISGIYDAGLGKLAAHFAK